MKKITIACVLFLLGACETQSVKENHSNLTGIVIFPEATSYAIINVSESGDLEVLQSSETPEVEAISFKLSPLGENGMMLSAKNSSMRTIKYDIYMIDPRGGKHYTNSCPLNPGSSMFESWVHRIPSLLVTNFRDVSNSKNLVCE